MADVITGLRDLIEAQADPQVKSWWENYVKGSAPFLGVKMPGIRAALHQWHEQSIAGSLELDEQKGLALRLLREEYAEEKLAGILFLQEILLPAGSLNCKQDMDAFARIFSEGYIYDWNICDWFCVKVLGPLIERQGDPCAQAIASWHRAGILWQARASVVAFVNLVGGRDYDRLIADSCAVLIRRPERFAKTAVGWILRDISKHERRFVDQFIAGHLAHFSLESLRNATKYYAKEEKAPYIRALKVLPKT